jgi:polysaccharide export outer membrane protein
MKQIYRGLVAVWMLVVLAGCASSSAPRLPPAEDAAKAQGPSVLVENYQMATGDNVQINVWKNPELSVSEPIRPDGKIAVPLVGDVHAAGKTPEQLAADIKRALGGYIKNPNVTVILTNLEGYQFLSRIRVTGSVGSDSSMLYQSGMTVLDAVLEAGSVDEFADANNTKLYRRTGDSSAIYDIRLRDIMEEGDMTTNVYLLPGDVIIVPERLF